MVSPSSSAPADSADLGTISETAQAFETARASGNWPAAWALLSPYSQVKYGSIDEFAKTEAAYNASGGSRFIVADPTRDPSLLAESYLGAAGVDARAHADFSRAAIVFANHPDVAGASEASGAYLVAPTASGVWLIWVAR